MKIKTQKSVAFLYISNGLSARKFKEIMPFTMISKRIKNLGINLPREAKDQYAKNYKTLMKEIKDKDRKKILCSWIRRINIAKKTIISRQSIDSM